MSKIEIQDVFRSSKFGNIYGVKVLEGTVRLGDAIIIPLLDTDHELVVPVLSMRRFKTDLEEAEAGIECGIGTEDMPVFVTAGDILEVSNA
jgi:translation initiation factor IF-2